MMEICDNPDNSEYYLQDSIQAMDVGLGLSTHLQWDDQVIWQILEIRKSKYMKIINQNNWLQK